jgi:hypothetical protein
MPRLGSEYCPVSHRTGLARVRCGQLVGCDPPCMPLACRSRIQELGRRQLSLGKWSKPMPALIAHVVIVVWCSRGQRAGRIAEVGFELGWQHQGFGLALIPGAYPDLYYQPMSDRLHAINLINPKMPGGQQRRLISWKRCCAGDQLSGVVTHESVRCIWTRVICLHLECFAVMLQSSASRLFCIMIKVTNGLLR